MKETGLTLKEAIESGRPYKRPKWIVYGKTTDPLSLANAIATDYKLEPLPEEKIEISEQQLAEVVSKILSGSSYNFSEALQMAKRQLGFK